MEEREVLKVVVKKKNNATEAKGSRKNGHVVHVPEQINGDNFEYEDGLDVLESFVNGSDTNFDDFGGSVAVTNDSNHTNGDVNQQYDDSLNRVSDKNQSRGNGENYTNLCNTNDRKYNGHNGIDCAVVGQRGYSRNVCDLYRHENDLIFGRTRGGVMRSDNDVLVVSSDDSVQSNDTGSDNGLRTYGMKNGNVCNGFKYSSRVMGNSEQSRSPMFYSNNCSVIAPLAMPESFSDEESNNKPPEEQNAKLANGSVNGGLCHEKNKVETERELENQASQVNTDSSGQTASSFDEDSGNYLDSTSLGDQSGNTETLVNNRTEEKHLLENNAFEESTENDSVVEEEDIGNEKSETENQVENAPNVENENQEEENLEYTSDFSNDLDEGNCFDEIEEGPDGNSAEDNENPGENVPAGNGEAGMHVNNVVAVNEQLNDNDSGNDDIADFIEADLPPNVERFLFFARDSSSDEDEGCGDEVLPNNEDEVVSDNETVNPTAGEYLPVVRIREQKVQNDSIEDSCHGACNILSDVDSSVRGGFSFLYPCNISCDKSTEENDSDSSDAEEDFKHSYSDLATECAACGSQTDENSSIGERNSESCKGDNLCVCCERPMELDSQRQKEMGVNVCDQCFRENNSEQNRWSESLFGARQKSRPSSGSNASLFYRNSLNPVNNNYDKVSNNSPLYGRFSSSDSDPFDKIYVSDSSEMVSPEFEAAVESVFHPTSRSPEDTMALGGQVNFSCGKSFLYIE